MKHYTIDRPITEPISDARITVTGKSHGIELVDPPTAVALRNVVIDCSRVPRGYDAHGVRVSGIVRGLHLDNVTVVGASHYGFGFQRVSFPMDTGAAVPGLRLDDCVASHCDADGFDFKVLEHFGDPIMLVGCTAVTNRVGFDLRGPVEMLHCHAQARVPYRFHDEPARSPNGLSGSGTMRSCTYTGKPRKGPTVRGRDKGRVLVSGWERI